MKTQFKTLVASTFLIGAALTVVLVLPGAADTRPVAGQELANGTQVRPRSPLFEALAARASEDAARPAVNRPDPAAVWDRERAFVEMERLRAEIVTLSGLGAAQKELLLWNRERIKTGAAPAFLPPRLCRQSSLGAWCPLLPPPSVRYAKRPANDKQRMNRNDGIYR